MPCGTVCNQRVPPLGAPPFCNATTLKDDMFNTLMHQVFAGCDAALARDASGRIMVIKRHGNKFAGRLLGPSATAREQVDALVVDHDDNRFGSVRLSLTDASYWADAINRL